MLDVTENPSGFTNSSVPVNTSHSSGGVATLTQRSHNIADQESTWVHHPYYDGKCASRLLMLFGGRGRLILFYTSQGAGLVTMSLGSSRTDSEPELHWVVSSTVSTDRKVYKVKVSDIVRVSKGKSSKNLQFAPVEDELCVSVYVKGLTLDMIAASSVDRSNIYKGFKEVIGDSFIVHCTHLCNCQGKCTKE